MPKTNLETIPIEEIAYMLNEMNNSCEYCIHRDEKSCRGNVCKEGIYKWLISEAKEE